MATKVPPRQLSRELRETHGNADLNRRRWIVGLNFLSLAAGKAVGLYQMGMIKTLPDPPVDLFDSPKVDASDYAYKRLQTPDAFAMLISTSTTAMLAAAGGVNRAEQNPALPLLMAAKALSDVAVTAELTREEWAENKALCFYCQIASACSIASAVLSMPEALRAIKALNSGKPNVNSSVNEFASAPLAASPEDIGLPRSGTFIAEDRLEATPDIVGATESLTFNGISPTSGAPDADRLSGMNRIDGTGSLDAVDEDSDNSAADDLGATDRGTRLAPTSNFATAR